MKTKIDKNNLLEGASHPSEFKKPGIKPGKKPPGSGQGPIKGKSMKYQTKELYRIMEEKEFCPFEFLIEVAKGNHEFLGYESDKILLSGPKGLMEKEVLPVDLRVVAAKEAAQYVYPKRKSIELTGDDEKPIHVKSEIDLLNIIKKARG